MLKYAVLFLLVVSAFADAPCCEDKERSTSYLDVARDLILKAKNIIPDCKKNKECPEAKECPEEKECPEAKECPKVKECPTIKAVDCADLYEMGYNKSGLYNIRLLNRFISNKSIDVFCDMDTDGGGWTVIQRRGNFGRPDDYFYKEWASYKEGFGDRDQDFWLGNDNIFALTNQKPSAIRFDLQDKDLKKAYAVYADFWIDDESNKYMLHISNYSGNAGDSMMMKYNNKKFTTKDQNNDASTQTSCAVHWKGAWWYDNCYHAHLNGLYNAKENGISWHTWRNASLPSLIWTEMKIRPKSFALKVFR